MAIKKVYVDVEFIKEAYDAACQDWKDKLIEKFPNILLTKFKKGDLVKRAFRENLVILVTKCLSDTFDGTVIQSSDSQYPVGTSKDNWTLSAFKIHIDPKIDVAKILNLK